MTRTGWGLALALGLAVAAGCSQSGVIRRSEAVVVAITLSGEFNLRLVSGLKIVVDSAPDGGPLGLSPQPETVGEGATFSTEIRNDDPVDGGDADNEFIVRFPTSPFVTRTFEFALFPTVPESVPFALRVEILGQNGTLESGGAVADEAGQPIRFRSGTRIRVPVNIACRPDLTCVGPNRAPAFGAQSGVDTRTVVAGETIDFAVHAFDPDGDRVIYDVRMAAPGGTMQPLSLFDATFSQETRSFTWAPVERHVVGLSPARYQVEFVARDPAGLRSAPFLVAVLVHSVNRAPVFANLQPQTIIEGSVLAFEVRVVDDGRPEDLIVASNHGVAVPGAPITFERVGPQSNVWNFRWPTLPTAGSPVPIPIEFTASDGRNEPVKGTVSVTILDPPPFNPGSFCNADADCQNQQCTDGVCCLQRSCGGDSMCTSPRGECKKIPGQVCTAAAECSTGFCVLSPGDSVAACCRSTVCFTGLTCLNSSGECKKKSGSACSIPDECASGFCVTGTCCQSACTLAPAERTCANLAGACLRTKGVACVPDQCQAGLTCVDGVCCGSAACPRCHGCNVAGSGGDCAPREEEDPQGECSGTGPCKQICRAGACVFPGTERTCDDGDACTTQDSCSGDGRCVGNPWALENPTPAIHFSDLVALPGGQLLAASLAGPVYRHDGQSWNLEDTKTLQAVRAFFALGDDDLFGVGDRIVIRRKPGVPWAVTTLNAFLRGVWAASDTFAFAVGREPGSDRPVIYAFDGTRWAATFPGNGELHAVSGYRQGTTGRFLVVAVGINVAVDGTRSPWLLVNDGVTSCGGSRWCRLPVTVPPAFAGRAVTLRSVVVWGLEEAAAVGDESIYIELNPGRGWETRCFGTEGAPGLCPDNPPPAARLTSIARSASDGWLHVLRGTELFRGNAGVWLAPLQLPAGTRADKVAALGQNDVRFADSAGGLSRFTGTFGPMGSGTNVELRAVWVAPGGAVYAAGDQSTVLRRGDGGWQPIASPAGTHQITALQGFAENRLHATTDGGTVLTFNGTSWGCSEQQEGGLTTVYEPPPDGGPVGPITGKATKQFRRGTAAQTCSVWPQTALRAINIWGPTQLATPLKYFAATGAGVQVYQAAGAAWNVFGSEEPVAQGRAVWGNGVNDVWAVGNEIKRYNGSTWASAGPTGQNLCSVGGANSKSIVAIGGGCVGSSTNTAVYFNGATWTTDRLPSTVGINQVAGSPVSGQHFAVGAGGVIMRRCPIPAAP